MKKAMYVMLLAVVMSSILPGCETKDRILEHADRAPRRYNTEYMSVGDFFDQLPLIAHGDTVMICGYRVNSKPMYMETSSGNAGVHLSRNGNDTVYNVRNNGKVDGVVPVYITNCDEGEDFLSHGTSDLWLVEECEVVFGTSRSLPGRFDYVELYCPSGKYVHSIPQSY